MRNVRANNSTIRGDNNHVFGDFNLLFGRNNTFTGYHNKIFVPIEQPSPVPLATATAVTPAADATLTTPAVAAGTLAAAGGTLQAGVAAVAPGGDAPEGLSREDILFEMLISSVCENLVHARAPARAPEPTQPPKSGSVGSALELPGDAVAASGDEPRCDICTDNRKDTLFEPCKHICCCRECARTMAHHQLQSTNNAAFNCPKCRERVTALAIVFI